MDTHGSAGPVAVTVTPSAWSASCPKITNIPTIATVIRIAIITSITIVTTIVIMVVIIFTIIIILVLLLILYSYYCCRGLRQLATEARASQRNHDTGEVFLAALSVDWVAAKELQLAYYKSSYYNKETLLFRVWVAIGRKLFVYLRYTQITQIGI